MNSNLGGVATGTGFFYRFSTNIENSNIPSIVTNKHVVHGAIKSIIHFSLADNSGNPFIGKYFSVIVENMKENWIYHPDNDVDLCIMPIATLLEQIKGLGHNPFFISLEKSLLPSVSELEELTAIEEVIMIGYPNGIWDNINNKPIVRKGITATHPNLDYNGSKEFMIDAACFPGSSGSPIFLFNFGSYATKTGDIVIGSRIKLLGILYAGPQYTATGEIQIIDVPTQHKPIALSRIPNNLGIIIKSIKLADFEHILNNLIEKK